MILTNFDRYKWIPWTGKLHQMKGCITISPILPFYQRYLPKILVHKSVSNLI